MILDDHYHLLLHLEHGADLKIFMRCLHGRTSFELNKKTNRRGRQVWHNYWDRLVESEADYWTRFNYIHHNPLKHGYVSDPADRHFSSYPQWLKQEGEEWMADVLATYPIVDFQLAEDSNYPAKASTPTHSGSRP